MKYESAQAKAAEQATTTGRAMAVTGSGHPAEYMVTDLAFAIEHDWYIWCRFFPPAQGILPEDQISVADALFWQRIVEQYGNPRHVVVKSTHYQIGPEDPIIRRSWRGFRGDRYNIKFHDGRTVISTNLWCQGTIPAQFREQLPDNAEFVKEITQ
jgi:hypothetical protein